MASPYRIRPTRPPSRRTEEAWLDVATFAFAFCCVILGLSLTGTDQGIGTALTTASGFVLLLTRPRVG